MTTGPRPRGGSGDRILGRHRGEAPGPTLLCVAGVHGNEPAGLAALQRVFPALEQQRPDFAGELVGIAGNRAALARGRRYLDTDLNRMWQPDLIEDLLHRAPDARRGAEDTELPELREALHAAADRSRGPVYLLDLHTTSSPSAPFGLLRETAANRAFAAVFGVPLVLGLEAQIHGALVVYATEQGWTAMDFEGGSHDDPASIDHHEAAIWIALDAAGNLTGPKRLEVERCRRRLVEATRGIPRYLEIFRRHAIAPDDGFRMLAGFENFHAVRSGQQIARDRDGAIRVAEAALLFMPLYQAEGDDGYFLARPVRRDEPGLPAV